MCCCIKLCFCHRGSFSPEALTRDTRSGGAKHSLLRTASDEASAEQEMLRTPKDSLLRRRGSEGCGPSKKGLAQRDLRSRRAPLEKGLHGLCHVFVGCMCRKFQSTTKQQGFNWCFCSRMYMHGTPF